MAFQSEPCIILLADDDLRVHDLLTQALTETSSQATIVAVVNGIEALDYLHRRRAYNHFDRDPLPKLILLDINMPHMDGYETLRHVRRNLVFASIPIVVMTGIGDSVEAATAYRYGADLFVTKPRDYQAFVLLMERLTTRWCAPVKAEALPEQISAFR